MSRSRLAAHMQIALALVMFSFVLGLTACGDTTTEENTVYCSGHGEWHGDHCDCDAGYIRSEDGLSCEPEELVTDDGQTGPSDNTTEPTDLVFTASSAQGSVGNAQDGSKIWIVEAMDRDTILRIELYAGYGAPTSPGTVDITNVETDYATCGTCLMLRTGCVAHGDHYDCTGTFMPRAEGQVQVDAIGQEAGDQLTGQLKEIVFQQVSIGQDYTTTPISGGDQLRLETMSFDVQLGELPSR